jgi:hypothetical protein
MKKGKIGNCQRRRITSGEEITSQKEIKDT